VRVGTEIRAGRILDLTLGKHGTFQKKGLVANTIQRHVRKKMRPLFQPPEHSHKQGGGGTGRTGAFKGA
jgi:hypothetical protein